MILKVSLDRMKTSPNTLVLLEVSELTLISCQSFSSVSRRFSKI